MVDGGRVSLEEDWKQLWAAIRTLYLTTVLWGVFFSELSLGTKHKLLWAKLVVLVANCIHKAQTQYFFGRARQRGSLNRGSIDDQSFLCDSPSVSYLPSCDTLEHLWWLWISRSGSCVACWMWTMRGVKRQTRPGATWDVWETCIGWQVCHRT